MAMENTLQKAGRFRLPDPPEREADEATAFDHIYEHANNRYLALHFGNPDSTLVVADKWIVASPASNRSRARRPDLLIAFGVSKADYRASNGYVVSEQGKPPDFVMEVASESTADTDTGSKRDDYAALGIPEYWRFDETGGHHGARLAGDMLQGGSYRELPVDEVGAGILQGYSPALNLIIRWDHGRLEWWVPDTQRPILTYEDQRERADAERAARNRAEGRTRELEEELRRLRAEGHL